MATTAATVARLSPEELTRRSVERRAVEAAIWGMPIASFDAMRQRSSVTLPSTETSVTTRSCPTGLQVTSPNNSSYDVYLNYNTKDGPARVQVQCFE